MQKHTPGPLTPCSGDAGRIVNIECSGPHNDLLPIATLRGPDRWANAHLFAAASDLLAALKEVEQGITFNRGESIPLSRYEHLMRVMREAIRKAEIGTR